MSAEHVLPRSAVVLSCGVLFLVLAGCTTSRDDDGPSDQGITWRQLRLATIDYLTRNPSVCGHTRPVLLDNLADDSVDATVVGEEPIDVNHWRVSLPDKKMDLSYTVGTKRPMKCYVLVSFVTMEPVPKVDKAEEEVVFLEHPGPN
jgi:hypothetical protein